MRPNDLPCNLSHEKPNWVYSQKDTPSCTTNYLPW